MNLLCQIEFTLDVSINYLWGAIEEHVITKSTSITLMLKKTPLLRDDFRSSKMLEIQNLLQHRYSLNTVGIITSQLYQNLS